MSNSQQMAKIQKSLDLQLESVKLRMISLDELHTTYYKSYLYS